MKLFSAKFLNGAILVAGLSSGLSLAQAPAGAAPAAAPPAPGSAPTAGARANNIVERVTFTNDLVNGKKTWLPATATLSAGRKYEFVLINKLKEPHGFRLVGQAPAPADGILAAPIVVLGGETKTVMVMSPKVGSYKLDCQLHPAHVGGTITVR